MHNNKDKTQVSYYSPFAENAMYGFGITGFILFMVLYGLHQWGVI